MHRSKEPNVALIREYVRSTLKEYEDYGPDYTAGGPYGVSFGSYDDLYDTFIGPFVDVFKTAAGKSKEIVQKTKTMLWVTLQATLTTIIPIYGYDYAEVFDKEKEKIDKIRSEYQEVYDRTDQALASNDAAMLAFMASPGAVLSAVGAAKGPKVLKSTLSGLTGGLSDSLYDTVKEKAIEAGRWSLGDSDAGERRSSEEPKKKSKKSPNEFYGESQLVEDDEPAKSALTPEKILKNKKFINKAIDNPRVREIQKVATETYRASLKDIYSKAEALIKNAKTIDDLQKLTKKPIKDIDKIKSLQGDEKAKAEKMLIDGVRKAMKDFYVKNLTEQVEKVIKAGIPEESQYIKDYRATIQKIKAL